MEPDQFDYKMYRGAFRNIAASTNERTFISTVLPERSVFPHTALVIRRLAPTGEDGAPTEILSAEELLFLVSSLNSFVIDYVIRQKITNHLDMHFVYSVPVPRLSVSGSNVDSHFLPIVARAARLICVTSEYASLWSGVFQKAWSRQQFWQIAAEASSGSGPQHEQDIRTRIASEASSLSSTWRKSFGVHDRTEERRDLGDRAQLRAEIDAYVAHLYGLSHDDFEYILGTFPVLERKERAAFGEFMSKRKCLEEYDRIGAIL